MVTTNSGFKRIRDVFIENHDGLVLAYQGKLQSLASGKITKAK
jgi:hypothetical protein